MQKFWQK
jgi:hypothetical protein